MRFNWHERGPKFVGSILLLAGQMRARAKRVYFDSPRDQPAAVSQLAELISALALSPARLSLEETAAATLSGKNKAARDFSGHCDTVGDPAAVTFSLLKNVM